MTEQPQPAVAANYSAPLADLVGSGQVMLDRFKVIADEKIINRAQQLRPVYVHLPLIVGSGIGEAIDSDTHAPADWRSFEKLLQSTDTPFVNLHLSVSASERPHFDEASPAATEALIAGAIADIESVVRRFGPGMVLVENDQDNGQRHLPALFRPEAIRTIIENTGCGFLLDIAHAYLAAKYFGMDEWGYLTALPVTKIREIHVSGVRLFNEDWVSRLHASQVDEKTIARLSGRVIDHLPLTEIDWQLLDRCMGEIKAGRWSTPWVMAMEYGGSGGIIWEALSDRDALLEQTPRLYHLVHSLEQNTIC